MNSTLHAYAASAMKRAFAVMGIAATVIVFAAGALVWRGMSDTVHPADVALVPGNKIESNGQPSARLKARLDRTVELYQSGMFATVIVSGGIGSEGYDEAVVMKDYLSANGIPAQQIITDNEGTNSYASAKNTVRILRERKLRSVLVVSQYFHVPRMKLALNRFGVQDVYTAHARYFEWRDIYSTIRELIGYGSYSIRHYETLPGDSP